MNSGNSRSLDHSTHPIRSAKRRVGLVVAALALAATGSVLVLTSLGGHHESSAQVTGPTPTAESWTPPTSPPLHYPAAVWLDPTGQVLPQLAPGTITAPCTHDNFTLSVVPQATSYPRGTAVVFRVSIVFTGPHPCDLSGVSLPAITVFDASHHPVWVEGGRYAGNSAYIPEGQLTAAGDALTRDVFWAQDICIPANCPEAEAQSGTYTAVVSFWPFGQSQPTTVQLD